MGARTRADPCRDRVLTIASPPRLQRWTAWAHHPGFLSHRHQLLAIYVGVILQSWSRASPMRLSPQPDRMSARTQLADWYGPGLCGQRGCKRHHGKHYILSSGQPSWSTLCYWARLSLAYTGVYPKSPREPCLSKHHQPNTHECASTIVTYLHESLCISPGRWHHACHIGQVHCQSVCLLLQHGTQHACPRWTPHQASPRSPTPHRSPTAVCLLPTMQTTSAFTTAEAFWGPTWAGAGAPCASTPQAQRPHPSTARA